MSLQTAFYAARSSLIVNSQQTSIVSRNIAGVSETGYARRLVLVDSNGGGEIRSDGVQRASDLALRDAMLAAISSSSADDAVSTGLGSLQQTIGDPQSAQSPSALIAALRNSLTQAASAPQDSATLASAVGAAKSLASGLNSATTLVQESRRQADTAMTQSVASINSLLKQFTDANAQIVSGQKAGVDVSDAADRRDAILSSLAKEIGIRTVAGPAGDTSIYTDNGATLFQNGPRNVTFAASSNISLGVAGNAVVVDGVPVTGPLARSPLAGGALAGLANTRDVTATKYQGQLDEIARGLIAGFAQTDQTGSSAPARTGLFTWSGGPSIPVAATSGLAAQISIDATADPSQGGTPTLLRDGGIGAGAGATYAYNKTGDRGYVARLYQLADAIGATQAFDASSGKANSSSVQDYATSSIAWLEAARKSADSASAQSSAFASQSTSALSNAVGVNIDDQMSLMLDLEHSYQASAKMMATVDTMYSTLFSAMPITQ